MKTNNDVFGKIRRFASCNSAFVIFVALFIVASIMYDKFLTYTSVTNLVSQNAMIGLLAFGMTFVVIGADIDLSVGSVMALCGIIAAKLSANNILIVLIVVLGVGIALGLINGFLVTKMDIVPFIATLSMMLGLRGVVYLITGNKSVPTPDRTAIFAAIGDGELIPEFSNIIIIYVIIFAICYYVLKYTKYGRYNYAVGGNLQAAKMMGIKTDKVRITNYAISGLLAAAASIIMTSRLGSGQYSAGDGWEMDAIAATVIGGTLLTGGTGGVKGTFFGVLILGVMKQMFNLQGNLNTWWQNIATGVILLVVVIAQSRASSKK